MFPATVVFLQRGVKDDTQGAALSRASVQPLDVCRRQPGVVKGGAASEDSQADDPRAPDFVQRVAGQIGFEQRERCDLCGKGAFFLHFADGNSAIKNGKK